LLDEITAVDIEPGDHPNSRARKLDDLLWLDHAIELTLARDGRDLRHDGRAGEKKAQRPA
jgi:hypothetical protein